MILALVGQKGGSGKSTTAICLAAEWRSRGQQVLLVDADPQGTARTWGELAAAGDRPLPSVVAMGAEMHRPDQLPRLARGFDVTLIDCPPREGAVQRSALMVADLALLPCGPTPMDAWALSQSVDLVQQARALRPMLRGAVLVTRRVTRSALGAEARTVLADCGLPVLDSELGFRVAFQEAAAAGQGVAQYRPRSRAAGEIRALATELRQLLGSTARPPGVREVAHAAA